MTVVHAVRMLLEAASEPSSARSSSQWLALVAQCQKVVNIVTAAQDAAMARLAAIEREDAEDGTVVDVHRPLGHCALDAPDLVSGVLPVTHGQAEHRVRFAVQCAEDTSITSDASRGLGGLHHAMATGVLDGYRAGIVAEELEEAPADVASTVVLALEPHLATDTPGALRRRCRRVLARVSPDLLLQRARRVREKCGLRRWADEPGVDHWDGTFPSEDAAVAWAAIDALAQRYVAEDVCSGIERARAKALTDLVAGGATVDVSLTLTVPAADAPTDVRAGVARAAIRAGIPHADTRAGVAHTDTRAGVAHADTRSGVAHPDTRTGVAHPVTRTGVARTDEGLVVPADAEAGCERAPRARADVGAGGGHSAAGVDASAAPGHAGACPDDRAGGAGSAAVGSAADSAGLAAASRDDDLVEVTGLHAGDPALVRSGWVREVTEGSVGRTISTQSCDRTTGAMIDQARAVEASYRPSARLAAFVRARDRRCRFPGCTVAARFCDLDHVRAWPGGPTSATNLMCLCRRHHRIKQRPGWRVALARDGQATWVDPGGTTRVTHAVDALYGLRLAAAAPRSHQPVDEADKSAHSPPSLAPDVHSALAFRLEHAVAGVRDGDWGTARRQLRHLGLGLDVVAWEGCATLAPLLRPRGTSLASALRRRAGPRRSSSEASAPWWRAGARDGHWHTLATTVDQRTSGDPPF